MIDFKNKFYIEHVEPFEKYELEAIKRIIKTNNVKIIERCNNNKYDFKDSNNIKYEVKADLMSIKIGNFYIENIAYNKLSGISISEANYYIITDGINYYMIDINILKNVCSKYSIYGNRPNKNKQALGYAINKNLIIEQSIII